PEEAGGLGLGLTDALAIALEAGRAQTRFPVIETIVAARLMAECRPEAVAPVLNGEEIAVCSSAGEIALSLSEGRLRGTVSVPFAADARWLALPVSGIEGGGPESLAAVIDIRAPRVTLATTPEIDLAYPVFRVSLDVPAAA